MQTVNIEIPDTILKSYQSNLKVVKHEIQQGFIIWEYLNGHLSLHECSELLNMSYRHFLEVLWSKGIPIDGLSDIEVSQQVSYLSQKLMDKS
jgi:predicted HTH domain antitoxin